MAAQQASGLQNVKESKVGAGRGRAGDAACRQRRSAGWCACSRP